MDQSKPSVSWRERAALLEEPGHVRDVVNSLIVSLRMESCQNRAIRCALIRRAHGLQMGPLKIPVIPSASRNTDSETTCSQEKNWLPLHWCTGAIAREAPEVGDPPWVEELSENCLPGHGLACACSRLASGVSRQESCKHSSALHSPCCCVRPSSVSRTRASMLTRSQKRQPEKGQKVLDTSLRGSPPGCTRDYGKSQAPASLRDSQVRHVVVDNPHRSLPAAYQLSCKEGALQAPASLGASQEYLRHLQDIRSQGSVRLA